MWFAIWGFIGLSFFLGGVLELRLLQGFRAFCMVWRIWGLRLRNQDALELWKNNARVRSACSLSLRDGEMWIRRNNKTSNQSLDKVPQTLNPKPPNPPNPLHPKPQTPRTCQRSQELGIPGFMAQECTGDWKRNWKLYLRGLGFRDIKLRITW